MLKNAWRKVTSENISLCWNESGWRVPKEPRATKKHKNEKNLKKKKKNLMGLRQFKACTPSHMRWELRWDSFHNVLLKRAFLTFQHSEHTNWTISLSDPRSLSLFLIHTIHLTLLFFLCINNCPTWHKPFLQASDSIVWPQIIPCIAPLDPTTI